MAITGGAKFFDKSQNLFADGGTIIASSGDATSRSAIDRNKITRWRSSGSGDTVTETVDIFFATPTAIDRILILDHNFKEFTIKYDAGAGLLDFTSVVGLDGALGGGITETTFSDNTAYYEFASVTVNSIRVAITKTQVADEEKFMNQFIGTTELGTLEGFPLIKPTTFSKNSRIVKTLSGRKIVTKSVESVTMRVDFKNYPARLAADITLAFDLDDRDDDFIVWLSGGRRGSDFFVNQLKGFRLEDALTVNTIKPMKPSYSRSVYTNQVNFRLDLGEVV